MKIFLVKIFKDLSSKNTDKEGMAQEGASALRGFHYVTLKLVIFYPTP